MAIPDGGACTTCKHRHPTGIPINEHPGKICPCSTTPFCGYELDATVIQVAQELMRTDPFEGKKLMGRWSKDR